MPKSSRRPLSQIEASGSVNLSNSLHPIGLASDLQQLCCGEYIDLKGLILVLAIILLEYCYANGIENAYKDLSSHGGLLQHVDCSVP